MMYVSQKLYAYMYNMKIFKVQIEIFMLKILVQLFHKINLPILKTNNDKIILSSFYLKNNTLFHLSSKLPYEIVTIISF